MKKIFGLLAIALVAGPIAANAVVRTYDFTISDVSGGLAGATASGYFSIDDQLSPQGGGSVNSVGLLSDLSFTWAGVAYDEGIANTGWLRFDGAGKLDGFLFGTSCSAGSCINSGVADDWFVAQDIFNYTMANGDPGSGTVRWSIRTSGVPEPGTLALLGLGLAGLGLSRRRKAN